MGETTCNITEDEDADKDEEDADLSQLQRQHSLSLRVWSKQVTNLNRCHSQNIIDGCVCTPVYVCCCKPIQNMCIALVLVGWINAFAILNFIDWAKQVYGFEWPHL